MPDQLSLTIPAGIIQAIEDLVRRVVAEALAAESPQKPTGFLTVDDAAEFLASTPSAVRSLVKRHAIPFHKAPNGRVLFERQELDAWVRSG